MTQAQYEQIQNYLVMAGRSDLVMALAQLMQRDIDRETLAQLRHTGPNAADDAEVLDRFGHYGDDKPV